uniref:Centrosomal protein of 162 kDa n=1 Tax=Schistocephalus solidus TaxID=70667 RepID=A0A0V0J4Y0_SCHSO
MQNHPDEKPAGSSPSTSDPMARIADLEKETHLQNELIKGFQRENEKLMAENKKLKEKAASSALPETQINSAERLFRENAVLHIELNQVKEELAVIKALRNAEGPHEARKKYECEIANLKAQNAELEQECQNHKQKCADTLQELKSAQVELSDLLKRCDALSQVADSAKTSAEARCQQLKSEADVAIGELKHKLDWYTKNQALSHQPVEVKKQENPPLSSQMALQGRIHELEVKIEEQKAAEQMCIRDLQQEFETLKIKYEEHIKLLETELAGRTSGSKLTKLSKSSSQPTIDGDCDQKTQVAGLQGQLSSLKSELIRRQRIIGSRQKMTTRREEADSVQVDVTKRAVPKPRPRLVSRANLRPKSSTTCSKVMTQEESQTECNTIYRSANVDVHDSHLHVRPDVKNVEVQTSALPEEVDFSGLQSKCADLQSRNKLLTEQIVSVSCALRANQKALKDMQVREDSRNSLIQHLKASLTKEKLKTLKNALKTCCDTGNLGQNGGEITVEKDRITLEAELPAEGVLLAEVGQSTARLRSELNITRQRADRLQMQLDTLRGLHLAAVTGKPPKKAIERLFDQLAFLEQQQELKNKHLEEYVSFFERGFTNGCSYEVTEQFTLQLVN